MSNIVVSDLGWISTGEFLQFRAVSMGKNGAFTLNDRAIAGFRLLWRFSQGKGRVFAHLYQSEETTGPRGWFDHALKAAKIVNFHWHDLRHTFASRLVMAGVDIRTVQELMGHKTITVTMRYSHLAPKHQLAAVQRPCDTDAVPEGLTGTKTDTDAQSTESTSVGVVH